MSATELLTQAMRLAPDQRAELAQQLLRSLEPEAIDPGADEQWSAELSARSEALHDGSAEPVDWREAVARIRANLPPKRQS